MRIRTSMNFFLYPLIGLICLLSNQVLGNQVFTSDCAFGLQNYFGADQEVCVSGDADPNPGEFIFPSARVYVTPNIDWTGKSGVGLSDVTQGGYNVVIGTGLGGSFFDEIVWLPPLTPGRYDVVLDDNQNGKYDAGDFVAGAGEDWEFQVGAPVGAHIDVAAIKGRAGELFNRYDGLARHWHWVSDSAAAVSIGWAVYSGDLVAAGYGVVSLIAGKLGIDWLQTDYNAAILTAGGKVIEGLAKPQADHWKALRDDPADPNFTVFANLDMTPINNALIGQPEIPGITGSYPFSPRSGSEYERTQVELQNNMAIQAALTAALMSSLEKYQGAVAAGDQEFTFLQARAVKQFADQLVINLNSALQALANYKAQLALQGLDTVVYKADEIQFLKDQLAGGLPPGEEAEAKRAGFTDADITATLNRIAILPVPTADFTRGGTIDDVVTTINTAIPDFQNLSAQAQAVMNDLGSFVLQRHPKANASGPYAGVAGTAITFNGSASTDPDGSPLTYQWDFDLDGNFGDATGATVNHTFNRAFQGRIGLKVINTTGRSDIAYASIVVGASLNQPPVITTFTPANLNPTASPSNPLQFSVVASDPESDPLSYSWTLDGNVVSNATQWTYTPNVGDTGTRIVEVTVSDANPSHPDVAEFRVVWLETESANQPPDAVDDTANTAEDTVVTIDVLVNDTDPDGDTLSISSVTQGTHGIVTIDGAKVIYTPAPNFNGPDSFTYTISDGRGGSDTATVRVNVSAVNDPPQANDDPANTAEDTAVTIAVLTNDTDPDGDALSISSVTQGAHGTVTTDGAKVTYTPATNFNGSDSFTYTISDGRGGSDTATVRVNVSAVNDPPLITSTPILAATVGVTYSYAVKAHDPDTNDVLSFELTTKPTGMNINPTTGSIQWTPTLGQVGANPVTVKVTDSGGSSDTQSFNVQVGPASCINDLAARAKSLKVQLTWKDTGAASYNIYRSQTAGGPYNLIATTTSRFSTYLDTTVLNGNTYYYVVREVAAGNEFCQSNEAVATPTAAPGRP